MVGFVAATSWRCGARACATATTLPPQADNQTYRHCASEHGGFNKQPSAQHGDCQPTYGSGRVVSEVAVLRCLGGGDRVSCKEVAPDE